MLCYIMLLIIPYNTSWLISNSRSSQSSNSFQHIRLQNLINDHTRSYLLFNNSGNLKTTPNGIVFFLTYRTSSIGLFSDCILTPNFPKYRNQNYKSEAHFFNQIWWMKGYWWSHVNVTRFGVPHIAAVAEIILQTKKASKRDQVVG